MKILQNWKPRLDRLSVRQRQILTAAGIFAGGVGAFWLVSSNSTQKGIATSPNAPGRVVTKPESSALLTPGQVSPEDAWLANAGKKVAQYDAEHDEQKRRAEEQKMADEAMAKRLTALEQRVAQSAVDPAPSTPPAAAVPPQQPQPSVNPGNGTTPAEGNGAGRYNYPPSTPPGVGSAGNPGGPGNLAPRTAPVVEGAPLVRVSLVMEPVKGASTSQGAPQGAVGGAGDGEMKSGTIENYLPVSFTRGRLLGGMDAPTGGQAQSNPLPVLIRLLDNAVLPNAYRSEVKECFIIASGFGDISSERAYLRTSNLSCVRKDNSVLEVKIEGNVYGEDGKLGLRGRLVTKQGQILANALRAGIVSGIGQGFSQGGTTYSSSPFGTLSTTNGGTSEQMRRSMAGGVGRALDNLANYYIRLAEQTYPVIEIDANRDIDVVLTKGVRITSGKPVNADYGTDTAQDEAERYARGESNEGD